MLGPHCQYRAGTSWVSMATLSVPMWVFMREHTISTGPEDVDVQGQHCQYRAGTSVGVHGNTGSTYVDVCAGALSVQGQYLCGCPGAILSVQGRYFCGCSLQHCQYLCGCLCGCTLSVQGQYLCGCPGGHTGSTWSVGQHISYWWSKGLDTQNFYIFICH